MKKYWRVKLYQGDDILVEPEAAAVINPAILRGDKHIEVNGQPIAASNIATVEETDQPVPQPVAGLVTGAEPRKTIPKLGPKPVRETQSSYPYDEPVLRRWAKKAVTKRQLKRLNDPKILYIEGGICWVAALQVIYVYEDNLSEEAPPQDGWEWCSSEEMKELG